MKKNIILLFLLLISFSLYGCINNKPNNNEIQISLSNDYYELSLDEKIELPILINDEAIYYQAEEENVIQIENNIVTAIHEGTAVVNAYNEEKEIIKKYVICVKEDNTYLTITGNSYLLIDQTYQYQASIYPESLNQDITWHSSDTSIVKIDNTGKATPVGEGLATITAYSSLHPEIYNSIIVLVYKNVIFEEGVKNNYEHSDEVLDGSGLTSLFYPLIRQACSFTLGINVYQKAFAKDNMVNTASALIYKRQAIMQNGEIIDDTSNIDMKNLKTYKYYIITNRKIIQSGNKFGVYNRDFQNEIEAMLVEYDDKVDLAVLTFESGAYFSVAKFADSDNIKQGEFCLAIGNHFGANLIDTASLGIISYVKRYLSDDTDGDDVNDWDSEYIQHDAAINEGSNGGPLINLKGEVIGINTMKVSSLKVEDMGFAIPSNLVLDIVSMLEQGIHPQRALLGVTAIEVRTILSDESYMQEYPIPEGINYGIYVDSITSGGVAEKAGVQPKDIILSINGVEIWHTYMLRAELSKFIINSGQKCDIIVCRNGQFITLTVEF